MELNEQQYQRVARFLDGEPLELTGEERAVALEIRIGLEGLDVLKQIQPSSGAMAMARKRMAGEASRPGRRGLRIACFATAVAAAAILLAVMALPPDGIDQPGPPIVILPPDVEAAIYDSENDDPDLYFIASELAELEADVYTPVLAMPVETGSDAIGQPRDIFWTDEP